ncbi:MAG TPA: SAM-dependent methyltransferase [Streptosporangiaceae bacterium]
MIGDVYERALAGLLRAEIEYADGRRAPLRVERWFRAIPGDDTLLDRCAGPTLDVGSGPGRLTVALAERGLPALGIDITPYAVELTRAAGGLALRRDVFGRVPGAGRWRTVVLADGNVGIGGDPGALLRRVAQLVGVRGRALVEVRPPGSPARFEIVRLRTGRRAGPWFRWAYVGVDAIEEVAGGAGLAIEEIWTAGGRWFAALN